VTFLDANADYVSSKVNFQNAFENLYAGVITYVKNAEVTAADPATMTLTTTAGDFQGDVINLIPRQKAGKLIADLGLNNTPDGRFAGVDVLSYASTVAGWEKVHIIGDSCGTSQPKAGHMGSQQAKVCADAIIRSFAGLAPDPAPVLSVTCYTNVTALQTAWVSGVWQYDSATKTMVTGPAVGSFAASLGWSGQDYNDSYNWFNALMADSFA
jgi:NADH dehydrogenase FAD-containing subunit